MQVSKEVAEIFHAELIKLERENKAAVDLYQTAIEDGDGLHDNPHQQTARAQIEYLAAKIARLQSILQVIKQEPHDSDVVQTGHRYRFVNQSTGKVREIYLLEPDCVEFVQGAISMESPLGSAMLGRKLGEVFDFCLPGGLHATQYLAEAL